MYKLDLHTHSTASSDGGLTAKDYQSMLSSGELDVIAVTDHDRITFATALHEQLGDKIIIGEEITTTEGEIIGLFLKATILSQLSPEETIRQVRAQNGLVYIPHPFETVRRGVSLQTLRRIAADVDIIEVYNGRAYFQNKSTAAKAWAEAHPVASASSSDAHGKVGWGRTYSLIESLPTRDNLVDLLTNTRHVSRRVGGFGALYPTLHRLKKRFQYGE